MPESSAWQQICRWQIAEAERGTGEEEFDETLIATTSSSSASPTGNENNLTKGNTIRRGEESEVPTESSVTSGRHQQFEVEELEAQMMMSACNSDKDDDIEDDDRVSRKTTASSTITQLDRDNGKIITLSSLTTTDNGNKLIINFGTKTPENSDF